MRACKITLILLFLALGTQAVGAETPLALPRLRGPAHLDGPSDEPAWQAIPPPSPWS